MKHPLIPCVMASMVLTGALLRNQAPQDREELLAPSRVASALASEGPLCNPICEIEGRVAAGSAMARVGQMVPVTMTLEVACKQSPPLASTEAEIVLLFDYSYSMTNEADFLSLAKTAVRDILRGLDPDHHRVAVIAYKSQPTVLSLLTSNFKAVQAGIDALSTETELASTSIFLALSRVDYVLRGDQRPDVPVVILILGEGDLEENDPLPVADALRAKGHELFAIGFTKAKGQLEHLRRIVGSETHYFPGEDLSRVQAAVRGLLTSPPIPEIEDLHLDVRANDRLPPIAGSAAPIATESAEGIVWDRRSLRTGEYLASYDVRAFAPGTFPVARSIAASYEACPGVMKSVQLAVPEVLVVALTPPPEPTPTEGPLGPTHTAEPTESAMATGTPKPTETAELPSPESSKVTPFVGHDLFIPLTFRRPRR